MIWFSPGVPLTRKAINAFICSKHRLECFVVYEHETTGRIMHHASLKQLYLK